MQREPNLVSHTHYCVVGDVTVDASAAIAPGVVLQASPGSRIVIGKGVCLAGGVCIQSRAGVLTIAAGATLGANVLVVGSGMIGANACVSPGSTVMNPAIEGGGLIPPNTLSGTLPSNTVQHGVGHNGASQNSAGYNHSAAQPFNSSTSYSNGYSPTVSQSSSSSSGFSSTNGFSQNGATPPVDSQSPSLPKNTFVDPGPLQPKPIQIPAIDVNAAPAGYDPSKNGVQLNQSYDLGNGSSAGNQSSALTAPSSDRVYGRDQVSELIS
ncbi:MAG: hypothetical protein AAFV46_04670, partial [Cyanobacteria bacterium J06635_11]